MGIISGLLDSFKAPYEVKKKIIACIKSKNAHDAAIVCRENGIDEDTGRRIIGIIESRGSLCSEAVRLSALACNEKMKTAADELIRIGEFFESSEYRDRVVLDFDTVSHTQYYNGILFCGYIEGVAAAALVGGRYDNLLKKMGKDDLQAMGFAINFYELDRFLKEKSDNSVNAVVLYDDDTDPSYLTLTVEKLCEKGLRTICERCLPGGRAYDIVVDVKGKTGGEVLCNA